MLRTRYQTETTPQLRRTPRTEEVSCYAGVIASISESRFPTTDKIAFAERDVISYLRRDQFLLAAPSELLSYTQDDKIWMYFMGTYVCANGQKFNIIFVSN